MSRSHSLSVFFCILMFFSNVSAEEIVIAVRAHSGIQPAIDAWQPTIDYLQDKHPEHQFSLQPVVGIAEMETLFSADKVDFVITQPVAFVDLENKYGASRMLTLIKQGGHTRFGSVIFTRNDRNGIYQLTDVKNKTISGVTRKGFGGWLIGYNELLLAGIDAYRDAQEVSFSGTHEGVVRDVISGDTDVGIVRTGIIEEMVNSGRLSFNDVRVLNPQDSVDFPYLHSSVLYPEWALAKARNTSPLIAAEVLTSLLAIKADNVAAIAAGYEGWSVPLDYSPVRRLMKKLKVGSYADYQQFNIAEYFRKNLMQILALLTTLLMLSLVTMLMFYRKNRQLQKTTHHLMALQDSLKLSNKKLKLSSRVFSDTHEGIIITNARQEIVDVNPAFCKITGYSREEAMGKNPSFLGSGRQSPEFFGSMWQEIEQQGYWQGDIWNRKKNGELFAELLTISYILDDNGKIINYIAVFTDITQSKRQQEKLSLMAHYDELTQLPNRVLFIDRFHQAIAHSKRTQNKLAICFMDLDYFKRVNDNYGHEAGNKLLIEAARRIMDCIRKEDTLSRQGGDEFALLLNDIESLEHCEDTLKRILDVVAQPYLIQGHSVNVTASIGVTLYPEDNDDIDTLLRHADQAMYQAKQSGKHRYHFFDAQQDQQMVHKLQRLNQIQQALSNHEFRLYYQPKVNMVSGEVFGVEALIRWIDPEKGVIPPLEFLPFISGTEIDRQIGNWVIHQALQQMDNWLAQGIKIEVSINIASFHLQSESFISELESALVKYPAVDSRDLQLEVLESSVLGDLGTVSRIIESCQATLGVSVSLDDFGTGYSSLTHLRSLSANTIKIDQSFVRDILDDPDDYTIVDGIISLADSFNREVIAEGVETTEHGLMLLLMGCNKAQGYGIARPMPAEDFSEWLSRYAPNLVWLEVGRVRGDRKACRKALYKLVAERWSTKFTGNIEAGYDEKKHWPIMNSEKCSCSHWIARAHQNQFFKAEDLEQLARAHQEVHAIAQAMLLNYQEGKLDSARQGLTRFTAASNEMSRVLERCD